MLYGFGNCTSAMLWRGCRRSGVEPLGFRNDRWFVERQQIRIRRSRPGQRQSLFYGTVNRIGIEAVGCCARGSMIESHANRKPAILLGHVLMNGVVRKARESAEVRAEKRFDIGNSQ